MDFYCVLWARNATLPVFCYLLHDSEVSPEKGLCIWMVAASTELPLVEICWTYDPDLKTLSFACSLNRTVFTISARYRESPTRCCCPLCCFSIYATCNSLISPCYLLNKSISRKTKNIAITIIFRNIQSNAFWSKIWHYLLSYCVVLL